MLGENFTTSIVIPAATRRLLGGRFQLRPLGRHEVRGFAEPVEAWVVEGVSVAESRFESVHSGQLTGLVGREHEIGTQDNHPGLYRNR